MATSSFRKFLHSRRRAALALALVGSLWPGAIAIGQPLGASGPRIALTAARQLQRTGGRYALIAMCVGVGQGIATVIERV